ncbi:HlyD family efflux transporter periplasmic adaptor subunit [Ruminococcus flavefaciens]|uniref:HlyD family efflux transporter periplasmic adaptor subunit n=1 Tax=Ruminococcus flavefaciens TaxID=1265 RepID=UPI0026EC383F|nr:biotin/lipoyl-binding protein [Ruminococcus flavefaciens]
MNETKEVKDILAERGEKEEKSPAKRRELIKTLIIVFLALMLVLTFFSNTIMNKSLAEISSEQVAAGKLTERIRDTGTVESNQSYEVKTDANRVIEKIHVKQGQEVHKDDVLFTVNAVGSEALELAETDYDKAKLDYETALLKEPLDYSEDNQEIKAARDEINALIAKRDAARNNAGTLAAEKERYRANKAEYTRLTALQTKLETAGKAINSDTYEEADPEFIGELPSLYNTYSAAEEEYKAAYALYEKALDSNKNVEITKADADAKQAVRDSAKNAYSEAKSSKRSEIASRLSEVSAEASRLNGEIEAYTESLTEGSGSESYESLAASVVEKQNALEKKIIELNKTKKSDSIKEQQTNLNIESLKKDMEKKKEKYEKLKKDSKATEIKSKYDGVVSSINVKTDDKTVEEMPLATIDLVDQGYTVKLTVDADKLKKVKKGITAEVMNDYSGDVEAVLTEIKSNPKAGAKKKDLVFSVTGSVESGETLDISIPLGSGTYDAIVPRSAVIPDNSDNYVLVVRSKNTPLGNRYYAERVTVTELAKDEVSSAVSGDIGRGDYVITASSKPIRPGDQVRMKDK